MACGVDVAAEGDALVSVVDPVDYAGRIAVMSGDTGDGQIAVLQQDLRLRAARDISRIQRHMAGKVGQVTEGTARSEQQIHKLCGGGKTRRIASPGASGRTEDLEAEVAALGYDSGLDEPGQLARVI